MMTKSELKRNNLNCIKIDNYNTVLIDFSNFITDNDLSNDDINKIVTILNKKEYLNLMWQTSSSVRFETSFIDDKISLVKDLNNDSLPEEIIEIEKQYWSNFLRGILLHFINVILKKIE